MSEIKKIDKRGAKMTALLEKAKILPKVRMAIICPETEEALGGAVRAVNEGVIIPVLFGDKSIINKTAEKLKVDVSGYEFVEAGEHDATQKAVEMVHAGKIDVIMKGSLHSDTFMAGIVKSSSGLRTLRRMSHVMVIDVPAYNKMLIITDCALNISPGFEEKKAIVANAIDFAHAINVPNPKVALLATVETVNDKIPVTLEWAKIKELGQQGEITGGIIDGPLSFDLSISKQSVLTKKITSNVAGDADILVVPEINCGNVLFKALEYFADSISAGLILGAKIPVILTSRSAGIEERAMSCHLARFYAHYLQNK
jgi:phosphate acetyltransferase